MFYWRRRRVWKPTTTPYLLLLRRRAQELELKGSAREDVISQAIGSLENGLRALMDAGFAPPDEVGYELEQAGEVVAEAELVWIERKLALLMPAHTDSKTIWEAQGWKTVVAEGDWQQLLQDELARQGREDSVREEQK